MESPKKQTSLTWSEIARRSRAETPPPIDARPAVRARLESELRMGGPAYSLPQSGLLDGILELFSRRPARLTLGACFGAAAVLAIVSTQSVDLNIETGEGSSIEAMEDFSDALVGQHLTEYL